MKLSDALATERVSASRQSVMLSRPAWVWLCTSASSMRTTGMNAIAIAAMTRRRALATVGVRELTV